MNQPVAIGQGSYVRANSGADMNRVYPRFFMDSVQDFIASEREGRPIYKEEERVEIIFPGNQHTKPVFKVTQEHADRWPEEYKAFRSGQEIAINGTPIEQWPILRRAQVLEMKALGFRTVEELAAMPDGAVQRIGMGGSRLRELAQGYLDDAKAQAALSQSTAENEKFKQLIAEQNEKIANQAQLLERISAQLLTLQNAPSPIATHLPAAHDPAERARQSLPLEPAAQSSLADLPAPSRKRRPTAAADESAA